MLFIWVFSVCLVGITVATGLRRQMVVVDKLPFPGGIACAATLREIYSRSSEATARVTMMGVAALAASLTKIAQIVGGLRAEYAIPGLTVGGVSASKYTLSLEPNLLMVGVGGLIGFRAGISMLLGAVLAWGVIAPRVVESGAAALRSRETLLRLPSEVRLEPRDRMEYRAGRGELVVAGRISDEKFERLAAMSADPHWHEALNKLRLEANHRFSGNPAAPTDYTTTRPIRRSVDLKEFPSGYSMPAATGVTVRYDPREKKLVAWGEVTPGVRKAIDESIAEFASHHPDRGAQLSAFSAAIGALAAMPSEPFAAPLPEQVAQHIAVVNGGTALRTTGALPAEIADAAKDLNPNIAATIRALVNGSAFAPPEPNFTDVLEWLLWPGVTLMVVSSLVAFGMSWRSIVRTFTGGRVGDANANVPVVDGGRLG
jgi:hypothetical protein